mmetsp:Transcript_38812/g.58995  ORF Transcript_38812/g.58995 Transcript_38812/m.58995 type:complete len:99 (+) Transcript_38812:172-468(+)
MIMGAFMYSNKRLLTPSDYTTDDHYRPKGGLGNNFLDRRFGNSQAFTVALVVIVILFFYLFWKMIIKTILTVLQLRKERRRKMLEEGEEENGGDEEAQ